MVSAVGSRYVDRQMLLTTLVELLEQDIGVSHSARAKLAALVAERGPEQPAARAGAKATAKRTSGTTRTRAAVRTR